MYFTLDNERSDVNGIISFTTKIPFLPTGKQYAVSALDADNDYDLSNINNDNRVHYSERVVEIEINLLGSNYNNLQSKIQKISNFLMSSTNDYVDLKFSNFPNLIWKVKLQNINNATTLLYKLQKSTLIFKAKAFPIGELISISNNITASQIINFDFKGDMPFRPILKYTGTADLLRIKKNENEYIEVRGINEQELIINMQNRYIKLDNNYIVDNWDGNYFEIPISQETLEVETNGAGVFTLDYNPLYLYNNSEEEDD